MIAYSLRKLNFYYIRSMYILISNDRLTFKGEDFMKKLLWIYSVNTQGVYLNSSGLGMLWNRSKKFQDQLRARISPEWELLITSYDIDNNDIPKADIIMYNEMDQAYIADEIKKRSIVISFQDLVTWDFDNIEKKLGSFKKERGV